MHARIGASILTCLLYGQALLGLAAIGAVLMKDPDLSGARVGTPAMVVAALNTAAM